MTAERVDADKVLARCEARSQAQVLLDIACQEVKMLSSVGQEAYWQLILETAKEKLAPFEKDKHTRRRKSDEVMNDIEVASFKWQVPFRFGVYNGQTVQQIPYWYLEMIAEDSDLKAEIRRFLRNPKIQEEREREQEGEDDVDT